MIRTLATVVSLLTIAGTGLGQEGAPKEQGKEAARDQLEQIFGAPETATGETALPPNFPEAPDPLLSDEDTRAAYLESLQEYYRYRRDGYIHRERVFQWQLTSTFAIFLVVLALVAVGIYFAWIQFKSSMASGESPGISEMSFSKEGIKVSSSVLGVIILVISLAFFYLYLRYVYPIENAF